MLIRKRCFPLTAAAAIAAVFALAFPPAGLTSAEVPPTEPSSSPALSSDDSVRDVAGDPATSGGTTEVVCVDGAGTECSDEDIEWAEKKIKKKCGDAGGTADIRCTETSVKIVGKIKCGGDPN